MNQQNRHVWVLASGAPTQRDSINGAAMLLRNEAGRRLASWHSPTRARSLEHAALLGIIEGLRQARSFDAHRVTVLCPFPELVARLNRVAETAWDEPLAKDYLQARALSHSFEHCQFRSADAARIVGITRLASNPSPAAAPAVSDQPVLLQAA